MKINKAWHEKHKMPKNPTFEERIKWHLAHQKNCSCREISNKLLQAIKAQNMDGKINSITLSMNKHSL